MLKELVIYISQYNNSNEYDALKEQAEQAGIILRNSFSDVSDPLSSYLITDSREAADLAQSLLIGFAVYLNDNSRKSDFADALYMIEDLSVIGIYRIIRMYQRFHKIPWHILDTERCELSEMCVEDLDDIYGVYDDPIVSKYAGAPYYDREKATEYIKDYVDVQYRFYEYGIWLVRDRLTREVIGRAGICGRAGYDDPEIGYVFAKRVWGRKYATEVIGAVIEYARQELYIERLNAFVMPENVVSVHILENFGFKKIKNVMLHDEEHIYMQLEL